MCIGGDSIKIIFLDIDGVLNGYGWRDQFIMYPLFRLFNAVHLGNVYHNLYDVFGVRKKYVKNLSRIVKKTGAKIVLSSTWRGGWYIPYEKNGKRMRTLKDYFKKYNIEVIGITGRSTDRAVEIKEWLDSHEGIESFAIIDDESFDIQYMFPENLVLTRSKKVVNICGNWRENTGLKRKFIKDVVKILNN